LHESRDHRAVAALAAAVCLLLAACGPRVFEASSAKLIESSAPLPPVVEKAKPPPRVEVTDDKIVIHEKIQFDNNKATIRSVSDDLLAEIARVMNENPRIKKIRVEGHASADGRHAHNVELSKRRAEADRREGDATFSYVFRIIEGQGAVAGSPAAPTADQP
jgi:outer membrane protein OmpA-like peptidoglycan-associated protein